MIDLSYLTEEEQEMIMTVLKRDVELKKTNKERIKQLQKLDPGVDELKYMTGDWFYEAKSQRHEDRIHGSDIVIASLRPRKPMTVEFSSQSWKDQPSGSDKVMTPKPESSGSLLESRTLEGSHQDRLNMRSASRPRHNPFNTQPMDLDQGKIDNDCTNGIIGPGTNKASVRAEVLPPLQSREAVKMQTKTEISDSSKATDHCQKPIPKRRTKLYTLQRTASDSTSSMSSHSVSVSSDSRSTMSTQSVSATSSTISPESTPSVSVGSDSRSTMSTQSMSATSSTISPESTPSMSVGSDSRSTTSMQSMSTSSGIRSPPPRGILKHNFTCNSSSSNIRSQLPQPLKRLGLASVTSGPGQSLDKHTITEEKTEETFLSLTDQEPLRSSSPLRSSLPKSRLPVRSSVTLSNPAQTTQEKQTVLPQLNLSPVTQSDDEHKPTDLMHTAKPKNKTNNSFNWLASAEPANQEMTDETMKEPLTTARKSVRSTLEGHWDKELSEQPVLQTSLPKLEKGEKRMSRKGSEKAQEHRDHPQNIVDQHGHESISITEASNQADISYMDSASQTAEVSLEYKSNFSPPAVNEKRKVGDTPTENYKHPHMVQPQSPEPTEEQGASIAKVLEWFSRSSDSSDKLDQEDSVQDIDDDIKMDDIDFESETDLRSKRTDNVYLIVPRQNDEKTPMVNGVFLEGWGEELNVETPETGRKTQGVGEQACEPESMQPLPDMVSTAFSSFKPENDTHRKSGISEKTGPIEKVVEMIASKDDNGSAVKLHSTKDKLVGDQQQESMTYEGDQPPKMTNLLSFWERANSGPRTMISSEMEAKKLVGVREVLNIDEGSNIIQEHLNKQGSRYDNQEKDVMVSTSFSDTNVVSRWQKSCSASLDGEYVLGGQRSACVTVTTSNNYSEGDTRSPARRHLDQRTKSEEMEAAVAKQGDQEEGNRAEKIKRLRSFWEKEKWKHRIYIRSAAADDTKSPVSPSTKLNKRLSKSEFDLRSIGTEQHDELEGSVRATNFIVLPLCDRTEKLVTAEGLNTSQFKTLREFWAGSSKQAPTFESKLESPLSSKVMHTKADTHKEISEHTPVESKPNQSDKINLKGFGNESRNTKPAQTTAPKGPDSDTKTNFFSKPSGEADLLKLSHFPQPQGDSQACLEDTGPTTLPVMLNTDSQARMSRRGMLNGKGNPLQHATSMFEGKVDNEDQGQELHMQLMKTPDTNLPPVRKTTEASMSPSRKMTEANVQLKRSPESTRKKEKLSGKRSMHVAEDTDSQPLTRSFVPQDYWQYLEVTENSGRYAPPQETEQTRELVCTPFQTPLETGCSLRCSSDQTCTPLSTDKPCMRGGNLELCLDEHTDEDLNLETVNDTDSRTHSWGRSNRLAEAAGDKESLVQGALRRAAARPAYHKSFDNLIAVPEPRKINQLDDSQPHSCHNSSSPSPPSSFSGPERLKKLSKSVPSFLHKNDEEDSDCSSEYSSLSSTHWRNGYLPSRPSGVASVSSVSESFTSVCSSGFAGDEVQGTIQFSLSYVEKLTELHIFIVQCQNLAAVDVRRNRSDPYVKSYLVPDSTKLGKRKTSIKKRTLNPTYKEILRYRVQMEYLRTQVLNLSVWHNDAFGRNCFLGETEVDLSTWDFGNTKINSLFLKSRHLSSQILNGLHPADHRGQMRLAVRFLSQVSRAKTVHNSGEVHIWVKDCQNLPSVKGATTDSYVKCVVLPDTSKKGYQKTRVLKRTANPVFNHTMVYDGFGEEDLREACVELTVWDRDRLLGGLRLSVGTGKSYGLDVTWMDSTAEEVALWQRMMESPNEWLEDMLPLRMLTTAKNTGR